MVTILIVFALVFFIVSAFWNPPKVNLGWLGMACLATAWLLQHNNV